MKARYLGVDGARGGWVFAELSTRGAPRLGLVSELQELFSPGPATLAIDMPMGLLGGRRVTARTADSLARAELGRRAVCVFSPPTRSMLRAKDPKAWRGCGLTRQSFHLIPKIAEVDRCLEAGLPRGTRMHEVHPELAFRDLRGEPLLEPKRTPLGQERRLALLSAAFRMPAERLARLVQALREKHPRSALAADDALDALVLVLVARDLAGGRARSLPDPPERDARGREMAIWRLAEVRLRAKRTRSRARPEAVRRAPEPDARTERILATVDDIPPGSVATYGQVASEAGLEGRARLVGRVLALHSGARGLPWWRVMSAAGRPSPGLGEGASKQRELLERESVEFGPSGRVDWKRFRWDPEA